MEHYYVSVIDPFETVLEQAGGESAIVVKVATQLNEWFQRIIRRSNEIAERPGSTRRKFDRPVVTFPQSVARPEPHELMIYLCPPGTSVVQLMAGTSPNRWPDPLSDPHQGVTENPTGALAGSEVWMKRLNGSNEIASLIFHEAMHNKLRLGAGLHARFNRCVLSCANITFPTAGPTDQEIEEMAQALPNIVHQWTEGQGILRKAAQLKEAGVQDWDSRIVFKRVHER